MSRYRTIGLFALTVAVTTFSVPAQESSAVDSDTDSASDGPFQFGIGITLGVTSFENDDGEIETFQLLGLRPEFSYGKVGLGLDLPLHYRFTGGDGDEFDVRDEDWVPDGDRSFLDVYLPKFRFIRYGSEEDDLSARFGGFSTATLGSGFIMNSYSNELFLPNRRIFGGVVSVDGDAFGAPYVGFKAIAGNMAVWDVFGARAYVRPLVTTDVPVLSGLQIGSSIVVDRAPFFHLTQDPFSPYSDDYEGTNPPPLDAPSEDVVVWGLDLRQPILDSEQISLDLLGDMAFQEQRRGGMGGFTGRLAGFLLYGGQLRITDDNFVPQYFNYSYDLRRNERYAIYDKQLAVPGGVGWLGRLGVAVFDDDLVFDTNVSGSFNPQPGSYPELRSTLTLEEGLIPAFSGFSFQGSYTKFDLRRWDDLTDAENAVIGARFNIRSGAVSISLLYDLTYDPYNPDDPWVVTSGLESTISF
ncbi:MAG: hypothetical protein PF508_15000 [Spirochaeta sp.]|jgi:hypothetical protein|nr:hypothetical protein [Spirochaeta sp.]